MVCDGGVFVGVFGFLAFGVVGLFGCVFVVVFCAVSVVVLVLVWWRYFLVCFCGGVLCFFCCCCCCCCCGCEVCREPGLKRKKAGGGLGGRAQRLPPSALVGKQKAPREEAQKRTSRNSL